MAMNVITACIPMSMTVACPFARQRAALAAAEESLNTEHAVNMIIACP